MAGKGLTLQTCAVASSTSLYLTQDQGGLLVLKPQQAPHYPHYSHYSSYQGGSNEPSW